MFGCTDSHETLESSAERASEFAYGSAELTPICDVVLHNMPQYVPSSAEYTKACVCSFAEHVSVCVYNSAENASVYSCNFAELSTIRTRSSAEDA
jgi:hypothetical protein